MQSIQNHASVKTQLMSLLNEQPDDSSYDELLSKLIMAYTNGATGQNIENGNGAHSLVDSNGEYPHHDLLSRSWKVDAPILLMPDQQPFVAIIPIDEYEEFRVWHDTQSHDDGIYPQEPPRTPEGDLEALAAIEEIRNMFPPSDRETAYYFAESEELSRDYWFQLEFMGEDG